MSWNVLLPTLFSSILAADTLRYTIKDGVKRDAYIGNLPQDAQLSSPSNVHLREFKIVSGAEFISGDPQSGDIRTARDIDREELCSRLKPKCSFDAEILATPQVRYIKYTDFNSKSPKKSL